MKRKTETAFGFFLFFFFESPEHPAGGPLPAAGAARRGHCGSASRRERLARSAGGESSGRARATHRQSSGESFPPSESFGISAEPGRPRPEMESNEEIAATQDDDDDDDDGDGQKVRIESGAAVAGTSAGADAGAAGTANVGTTTERVQRIPVIPRLRAEEPRRWVHISNVRARTSKKSVERYVAARTGCRDVRCVHLNQHLRDSDYETFKVGVPTAAAPPLLEPGFWPRGIRVREFHMRRRSQGGRYR